MFFTASIAAYANDLNSSSLSGNLFLNQLLFGVLIALSKIVGPELSSIQTLKASEAGQSAPHYSSLDAGRHGR